MRVTVLTTHTNNTPALYEPLRSCGYDVNVIVYDIIAPDAFHHVPWMVAANRPDFVVLIGAHENYHPRPVIPVSVLAQIGADFPFVHLCCDGAETVWWPLLQKYYDQGRFALQVNIDGLRIGPIGERGLTLLSPIDPAPFNPIKPFHTRPIRLGFSGSPAHDQERGRFLREMQGAGLINLRVRDDGPPADYREFLSKCRCVWNHPATGSTTNVHVKGRPIEAALAGAVVMEMEGSPLADWFQSGVDYLPYANLADIQRNVEWLDAHPADAEAMALRMHNKVLTEHSPTVFWGRVVHRLGLGNPDVPPVRDLPLRSWRESSPRPATRMSASAPMLLSSDQVYGVNFVNYDGYVYVVPWRLGPTDLAVEADRERPEIRRYNSFTEARSSV